MYRPSGVAFGSGARVGADGTLRIGDAGVRLTPEQALALAAQLQANAVLRLMPVVPPRPVPPMPPRPVPPMPPRPTA